MSRPWIATDDEGQINVDDLLTANGLDGQVIGITDVASSLRKRAGELFASKKDDLARYTRDLAEECEQLANKKREQFDKYEASNPWRTKK